MPKFKTTRFGEITFKSTDIIKFVKPILGFNEQLRYVMISRRESEPFKWLQSIEDPDICFIVADPRLLVDQYAVDISTHDIKLLEGSDSQEDYQMLVIATIPQGRPEDMSVNLQGPIVICVKQLTALQMVLNNPEYDIKHSVFRKSKSV